MTDIPAAFQDLLKDKKALANLATIMPDGSPQVTPVWFDYTNGRIRVNTADGTFTPTTGALISGVFTSGPLLRN